MAAVTTRLRFLTGVIILPQRHPLVLESIEFPEPVISVAVEPRSKADEDKLADVLFELAAGLGELAKAGRFDDRPADAFLSALLQDARHGLGRGQDHRQVDVIGDIGDG